jgi:hypothetical protein
LVVLVVSDTQQTQKYLRALVRDVIPELNMTQVGSGERHQVKLPIRLQAIWYKQSGTSNWYKQHS